MNSREDQVRKGSVAGGNQQKKGSSAVGIYSETFKNSQKGGDTNIEQNESLTETEIFHATVQTMLDCLGEKHPSSATSQIILPLKSQQSDKKSVSYSKRKEFIAKKIETYPNWDGKTRAGRVSVRERRRKAMQRISLSKLFFFEKIISKNKPGRKGSK